MTDAASTSGTTITTTATGANHQRDRNSGSSNRNRGNQRANNGQSNATQTNNNRSSINRNFKGDTEGMNGHVFQCYEERSDPVQFSKTMEALHSYSKKVLKTTDLGSLFGPTTPTYPTIDKPIKPAKGNATDPDDELEQLILKEEVKQYVLRTKELKTNLAALHSVAWGQCSEALKAKIKSLTGYQEKADNYDCVWLIGKIASVMQKFEETKHGATSMVIVLTSLLNCRQGNEQKVSDYVDRLQNLAETIEHHGGSPTKPCRDYRASRRKARRFLPPTRHLA